MSGTGVGQYRRVAGMDGRTVEMDRPWDVPPDPSSQISISGYMGECLLLDNHFTDIGVVQLYGTLGTVVRGNRLLSNAAICIGLEGLAQPSVRDAVVEGNLVRDNDTGIEVGPGTEGVLLRGNRFENVRQPLVERGRNNQPRP